jgi:hypothetical protein
VETAEIISHLAKNTKSSSAKINRKALPANQSTTMERAPKFKTGGLVVTATCGGNRRKPRDLNLNATTDTEDVIEVAKINQTRRHRKMPKENSNKGRMLPTPSINQ